MQVDKISGGYPGAFSLKNISFTLLEGKMYALLGLNGSGKTTLIKMLCGLFKAQSGNVFIEDTNILSLSERDRARIISYIPQNSSIIYDTTVLDIVLMGVSPFLSPFQTPNNGHICAARNCLKELGIYELAQTNYQNLSGGLKQITIIARALLQNGRYMIFDEPDSSLDLMNRNKLMKKIRNITKTYNKGSLISMHNAENALNYCDKIILLNDGNITEIDLNSEEVKSLEVKLSAIYGDIKILKYRDKYMIYYE